LSTAAWRFEEIGGIRLLRCEAFDAIPGIGHAFGTRVAAGRADFDLGPAENEDAVHHERRLAFARAAGFGAAPVAILRQAHGAAIADASEFGDRPPEADGVIRRALDPFGSPVAAVRSADCVGVLIADREGRAVAAVHAGWRGTAAGIAAQAVARLAAEGIEPAHLAAALGPAILGCCYEVGDDVVQALQGSCGPSAGYVARASSGRTSVDLHAALRSQLIRAGLSESAIQAAPYCTRCRNDLFFSFRVEGGAAGRHMAAIGPSVGP